MMNSSELKSALSEFQKILLLNKEAMPLELLGQIDEILVRIKEPMVMSAMRSLLGDTANTILTSLEKVLEIEKKLLLRNDGKPCMSDRMHESLGNLQRRPLVLFAIASAL